MHPIQLTRCFFTLLSARIKKERRVDIRGNSMVILCDLMSKCSLLYILFPVTPWKCALSYRGLFNSSMASGSGRPTAFLLHQFTYSGNSPVVFLSLGSPTLVTSCEPSWLMGEGESHTSSIKFLSHCFDSPGERTKSERRRLWDSDKVSPNKHCHQFPDLSL